MVVRTVSELGELSAAEKQVLSELDSGELTTLGDGSLPGEDDDTRRVRAALIRLLLLGDDSDPMYRLHEKGLRIRGAWIPERLDLEGCRGLRQIMLLDCQFVDVPRLRSAELQDLMLNRSRLPGLSADGLEVRGDMFLRAIDATGEVRLGGVKLGGDIDCEGATFRKGGGSYAVFGDRMEVGGGVFLRGVGAAGEFRLLGAKLGGVLDVSGARLFATQDAEGNLGDALSLDQIDVRGSVFLKDIVATGPVRLLGATIGGDVNCAGAKFAADEEGTRSPRTVLSLSGAKVSGALYLRYGASVAGAMDLTVADIGHICDDRRCWPVQGDLLLDRCRYGAFTGGPVDARSRLDWLALQDPARWGEEFWPQPYQQLATVLREMGHDDEAKTVLVAKEQARRAAELRRLPAWRKPFYWGFTQLLRMVGYGYRPALALIPAAIVVVLGWLVIQSAAGAGLLVPVAAASAGPPTPALVPLAYSIETIVPIVKLGQAEGFRPDMTANWGYWLQVYLWMHGFFGWLIGGIAAAGVLGLFSRE